MRARRRAQISAGLDSKIRRQFFPQRSLTFLGLFFVTFGLSKAFASSDEQTHALMTDQEKEIHQTAKKRLYPGGRDEDSLKVQSQLPQVSRKMTPVTDAPVGDEPPDAPQQND